MEKKSNWKSNLIGIIFVIWFICSLGGLLFLSEVENQAGWIFTLMGQYFLVFGILAVYANKGAKRFPTILIMFPLIGGVMLGSGIYMLIGGEIAVHNMFLVAPILIFLVFPIAGICLMHMALTEGMYLKKRCTYEVNAKCVDVSTSTHRNKNGRTRKTYMPTYSAYVNDKEIKLWNNKYSSHKFEVGEYYTVSINLENPTEFIDINTKKVHSGMLLIGTLFIGVSIIIGAILIINFLNGSF